MTNDHIVSAYDKELENLRSSIARMGGLAETQIAGAVDALFKRSAERGAQVVEGDKALDVLEIAIEKEAISVLARRQPMASDLREIVSALKMSSILERIGDYAKNIAKRVTAINEAENFRIVRTVGDMAHLVQKMLKDVLDAYIDLDDAKALDVWERDAAVDELYNSLFRELLTYMMEDPRAITPCTHLLFAAKNVERMGDHVTNLAEIVFYLVRGEILEDTRPKGDRTSFTVVRPSDD
ncbi:phosphate signaling complex protein PhoU [Iodidimonas sp. SYSU 1G8]|uniref:phosphate signaling complex protein PhoU n=1 Tax=Iodidimonas sp. SYSU 1G8 TaxID=3133967 RepID=UPI0031FEC200